MKAIMICAALLLASCGAERTTLTQYEKFCIDGVTYFRIGYGLTVALDKNSKIVPCTSK